MCGRSPSATIRGSITATVLLLLLGASIVYLSKAPLRATHAHIRTATNHAPLYLPEAKYIRLITLGFDSFASNILWFNTVNYFGKQYLGKKDYRWLFHMCTLVTKLDPRAVHVYEFCGSLLSWIAKEPERSNQILSDAIEHHPDNWRFYYLRGFNYWYFMEDLEQAKRDLTIASRRPNAPAFLASLASRLVAATENPNTAVSFLKDLIKNSNDETVRKALNEKLLLAYVSRDIDRLNTLLEKYETDTGTPATSLQDLVTAGSLNFVPKDPYGDPYVLDPKTYQASSASAKAGLSFSGKTARTGLLKSEFGKD